MGIIIMNQKLTFKINARTYTTALKSQLIGCNDTVLKQKIENKLQELKSEKINSWIFIDPVKESNFLHFKKDGKEIFIPFCSADDIFLNILDISEMSPVYFFSSLEFTKNVFKNTLGLLDLEENTTPKLEDFGKKILNSECVSEKEAIDFCRDVCDWGRQNRVFANIKRYNPNNYGNLLANWFNFVIKNKNPNLKTIRQIADMGDDIKGLGLSFASKHLRMLNPKVFPVLDDVLARGLGFMLNSSGYSLFINSIHQFKHINQELFVRDLTIADIEMILFLLTRQFVRSEGE